MDSQKKGMLRESDGDQGKSKRPEKPEEPGEHRTDTEPEKTATPNTRQADQARSKTAANDPAIPATRLTPEPERRRRKAQDARTTRARTATHKSTPRKQTLTGNPASQAWGRAGTRMRRTEPSDGGAATEGSHQGELCEPRSPRTGAIMGELAGGMVCDYVRSLQDQFGVRAKRALERAMPGDLSAQDGCRKGFWDTLPTLGLPRKQQTRPKGLGVR